MAGVPIPKKSLVGRLLRWVLLASLIVVVLFAVAVLNNNYSLHRTSRAEFTAQMDRAIDSATTWIVQQQDIQGNPPLMFMIGDMAQMSGDPRLRSYIASYLASPRVRVPGRPATWYYAHWVDPSVPLPMISASAVPNLGWQDSWFMYATAPDRVPLPRRFTRRSVLADEVQLGNAAASAVDCARYLSPLQRADA